MASAAAARPLSMVLLVAGLACTAVALLVLLGFGGWTYYTTPLGTRGYLPQHAWLRPSGTVGLPLGVTGACAMLCTLPYAVRKRWRPLKHVGTVAGWLEVHIFFGIVGPVLVTLHTSFKFNGLISVGYWLMMTVWASGFIGRYLYVRIPKGIRGAELTRAEIDAQLADARVRLATLPLPEAARTEIEAFQSAAIPHDGRAPGLFDLFLGEFRVRTRLALLRRHLTAAGIDVAAVHDAVELASSRAVIARRVAHLTRTRHLFELWHVFHRPLVFAMAVIVGLHVAVALYLGYARLGS